MTSERQVMNEREYIARLESATPSDLREILSRPTPEQERVLRAYLGDARYGRMRNAVLDIEVTRAEPDPKRNVVVLHGIMGGELAFYKTDADPQPIWLKIFRIMFGDFSRFSLDDNGENVSRVEATGILKRFYGEQLLGLMKQGWNTRAFWYDWRMDVNRSADILAAKINEWFGAEKPVNLVAHSMGGLVSRAYILRHPERWSKGGRLVMLGTPNQGSFAIPQLLMGLNDVLQKLTIIDVKHNMRDLVQIAKTFVGTYQMLPSPIKMPDMARLYDPLTYGDVNPLESRFAEARAFHESIQQVVDPARMTYVAGFDQPTYCGITDWKNLGSLNAYQVTRLGDGTVPHSLGLLDGVPTFYVKEQHGNLPGNAAVIEALSELIERGESDRLLRQNQLPALRGDEESDLDRTGARQEIAARLQTEMQELAARSEPLKVAANARGEEPEQPPFVSEEERKIEDLLVSSFAGATAGPAVPPAAQAATEAKAAGETAQEVPKIRIRLVPAGIQTAGSGADDLPVDAISVGHYIGVRPVAAELALDKAISLIPEGVKPQDTDLLLTIFTVRGILHGSLGQFFFLDDPRAKGGDVRLVAVAGMGYPGRFGRSELITLSRELCWSLGRLKKRHLASVVIGSGEGNIPQTEAVEAWLEGIKRAIGASAFDAQNHLQMVSFYEFSPERVVTLNAILERQKRELAGELDIEYIGPPPEKLQEFQKSAAQDAMKRKLEELQGTESANRIESATPTRLTVEFEGGKYKYAAITETASVPEREVPLDPDLVKEANTAIVSKRDPKEQEDNGEYLRKLLIPGDLSEKLATNHPLLLTCDSTVARVHWEMVAQPEPATSAAAGDTVRREFLGLHRGLTRQLKTGLAPIPDPPPPPNRVMRVLVIGDPAKDKPLPGAQAEAKRVCELFSEFKKQLQGARRISDVQITLLLGPAEATRTRVMQELLLGTYDVLHYAGHCVYEEDKDGKPLRSGWIFSDGKLLTANELSRVENIPKFIFSNACESGITPDRAEMSAAGLAPTFAEAFFARGVHNFVCTAWRVNDQAALEFATRLYRGLLALDGRVEPMHVAMREARKKVFEHQFGARTWGAYQHYGDPYFKLIQ
jgi:pimeloyl-ACP methyl ester carboxylesterase